MMIMISIRGSKKKKKKKKKKIFRPTYPIFLACNRKHTYFFIWPYAKILVQQYKLVAYVFLMPRYWYNNTS